MTTPSVRTALVAEILDKVEAIMTRNGVPSRAQLVVTAYLLEALDQMYFEGYNDGYVHGDKDAKA